MIHNKGNEMPKTYIRVRCVFRLNKDRALADRRERLSRRLVIRPQRRPVSSLRGCDGRQSSRVMDGSVGSQCGGTK